jgi:hypothetical protein
MSRCVRAEIERDGRRSCLGADLSADDIAAFVRNLEAELDATLSLSRIGSEGRLLLAVSRGQAFLGLELPEGLLQYVVASSQVGGTQRFRVGGQEVDIESRYVLDMASAATVVLEWLADPTMPSSGDWERQ